MATISCSCRSVRIRFASSKPRCVVQCCCKDCLARLSSTFKFYQHSGQQPQQQESNCNLKDSTPHNTRDSATEHYKLDNSHQSSFHRSPDPDITAKSKPATLQYVENKFVIEQGRNEIYFFKLRADTGTISMGSKCCHALLAIQHPRYQGNVIGVYPFSSGVHSTFENQDPIARFYTQDWTTEELSKADLKPLPHIWRDERGERTGSGNWQDALAQISASRYPVPPGYAEGETFDDIMQESLSRGEITVPAS